MKPKDYIKLFEGLQELEDSGRKVDISLNSYATGVVDDPMAPDDGCRHYLSLGGTHTTIKISVSDRELSEVLAEKYPKSQEEIA